MKMNITSKNGNQAGFTLIEMIGVLAVIAILAALLLPKVANAISDSKVNSTVGSYQSVQAATTSHYGKYLAFNSLFGTNNLSVPASTTAYDTTFLIPEGFLDHPFSPKVGLGAAVQVVAASAANGGTGYSFTSTASGTNNSTSSFQYVVECSITNVSPADAYSISLSVDGQSLTSAQGAVDNAGKITYDGSSVLHMYVDGR